MSFATSNSPGSLDSRPPPLDLSHHLSRTTKARKESEVKSFYKYFRIPGIGQLAGGLPNNSYFPFDTLEAKVARPGRWEPTPNNVPINPPWQADNATDIAELSLRSKDVRPTDHISGLPQDAIEVPHTSSQTNPIKKIDLDTALQYGTAQGFPPLYYFVRQFAQENLHVNCPYKGGPEIVLSCGNTDGLSKCLQAFSNEWSEEKDWIRDRDGLLLEKFAFMSAVQSAKPRGLNIVPVEIDDEGMTVAGPGGLKDVLENWDFNKGRRPRLMYTITQGQNPTSTVLSLQRRREIYALCQKYDILIIEDDPYWYLQFPSATAVNTMMTYDSINSFLNPNLAMFTNGEPHPKGWKSSGYEFIDSLVPSSISIDTDGRVIRLDTFSKTVAPGCRLGWITAQPALIERLQRITESTTQQPSGFVQGMIAELLLGPDQKGLVSRKDKGGKGPLPNGEGWKADGWVRWLEGLRGNYERRMRDMSSTLDEGMYLVKAGRRNSLMASEDAAEDSAEEWAVVEKLQMYSFDWPVGGMFLWLKVLFENHPLHHTYKKTGEVARLARGLWIYTALPPHRVLVAPGAMFSPTDEVRDREGYKFFRLCFAAVDAEDIIPISKRLADAIAAFWRIKDKKVIDKILEEADKADVSTSAAHLDMAHMVGFC